MVLSIGTRGKARKLGVAGEALPKVTPLLGDPAEHRGQRVVVVGGGDSAVEAAIALADTAQRVTLSYRGKSLSRCKAKNRQKLDEVVKAGRVVLRYATTVHEIKTDVVVLKAGDQYEQIANDHVFVCIGGDAPIKWLESVGVRFIEQPHLFSRGPTDKLVEQLIGAQRETTREGAGGGAQAAVMHRPRLLRGRRAGRAAHRHPLPRREGTPHRLRFAPPHRHHDSYAAGHGVLQPRLRRLLGVGDVRRDAGQGGRSVPVEGRLRLQRRQPRL